MIDEAGEADRSLSMRDRAAADRPEPLRPHTDPARLRKVTAGSDRRGDPAERAFVRRSKRARATKPKC